MTNERFEKVFESIEKGCAESGRKRESVKILGVAKKQETGAIQKYIDWCEENKINCLIGENYLQEFEEKKNHLRGKFNSHFIGRFQSNKAKKIVSIFNIVETIGSLSHLEALNKAVGAKGIDTAYSCFLQVNVSDDPNKGGFPKSEVGEFLAEECAQYPRLNICGLMAIPEAEVEPKIPFMEMRRIFDGFKAQLDKRGIGEKFKELSMGMSSDYLEAIKYGSTEVRIGSLLFGARS